MRHGPAADWKEEKSEGYKTSLGLWMVALFTPVYLSFVLISVISPTFMARDIGSLNVAIVFGFGIIILAIVQALIYNYLCSKREKADGNSTPETGDAE